MQARIAHPDAIVAGRLVSLDGRAATEDDPLAPFALISASLDGTVCRRELGSRSLEIELQGVVGRNLYESEWEDFNLPGEYESTFTVELEAGEAKAAGLWQLPWPLEKLDLP